MAGTRLLMRNAESIKSLLARLPGAGKGEALLRVSFTLLLALLIARTGAGLTWQLVTPLLGKRPTVAINALPEPLLAPPSGVGPNLAHPAVEIALFGEAGGTAAPLESSPVENAPATTLNLLLKGVIAAQPMSRALAIIAEKGGNNEQLYGLGDKIPGGASIREIHVDRVIISRGGTLETLFLEGTQPTPANQGGAGRAELSLNPGGANISARGDGVNWRINQDYWEERLADLPGLAREVGVEIYTENNQQKGYRLISAQGSRLLTSLGLQAGDILLSVNGRAMNSVQDGLAAYQQIRSGGRVQVEINRNGRRESKVYNIDG